MPNLARSGHPRERACTRIKSGARAARRLMDNDARRRATAELKHQNHNFPGFAFPHAFAITQRVFRRTRCRNRSLPYRLKGPPQAWAPPRTREFCLIPASGWREPRRAVQPPKLVFHHLKCLENDRSAGTWSSFDLLQRFSDDPPPGVDFRSIDFDSLPSPAEALPHRLAWRVSTDAEQRCCEFAT